MPAAATAANAKSPTANLRIRTSGVKVTRAIVRTKIIERAIAMNLTLDVIRDRLNARSPRRGAKPHAREAAVAAILAPGGASGGWDVLMIRRAERSDDPWSGQMALPGGRKDPLDADLLATAVRETAEETAVALSGGQLLGELDDVEPSTPHLPDILIRPFVFGVGVKPPIRLSDEVAGHVWVPVHELPGWATQEEITVRGSLRRVRGYRVGDALVWGLTERILTPFLELIR